MTQFKTLQFPNTPGGQAQKVLVLQRESAQGWQVVSETIVPGKFKGGKACCLFVIFAPCAFLAGHHDDVITVTLKRDTGPTSVQSGQSVQGGRVSPSDNAKWNALVKYDSDIAASVETVRPLGPKWSAELASAYMALNDKKYLSDIVAGIRERARLEEEEKRAALLKEEETKNEERKRLEQLRQARHESHLLWYERIWGTNRRRIGTTTICSILAVLLIWSAHSISRDATTDDGGPSATLRSQQTNLQTHPIVSTPSFDCAKVHSHVLKLICATPELAAYDQQLATAYQAALFATSSPRSLRLSERRWIRQRNNTDADVGTLKQMYKQRIDFLEDVAHQGGLSNLH